MRFAFCVFMSAFYLITAILVPKEIELAFILLVISNVWLAAGVNTMGGRS